MEILNKIKNRLMILYKRSMHDWGINPQLYKELFQFMEGRGAVNKYKSNEKAIYVEFSYVGLAGDTLKKIELAYEIAQEVGGAVFAVCDRKRNQLSQLFRCIGFQIIYESQYFMRFPIQFVQSFIDAIKIMYKLKTADDMLQIRYKGILIGDCIYTYILRHTMQVYTIDKVEWKRDFPVLLKALINFNCIWKQFGKYRPEYYVLGDSCYLQGIYVRIAQRFEAKLYECVVSRKIIELPHFEGDIQPNDHDVIRYYIEQRKDKQRIQMPEINKTVEELLKVKFLGKGNKDTVCAFADKKSITSQMLKEEMGLNPFYKNVIIMCHCFSDNAHCNNHLIYNDYYVWLEETLKIIREIKNVNWIIRAHPSRKLYGESDEVWKLYRQYKSEYMFYFPEEYSGELVKEIADVIVTVTGTAGYEYSCFKIPVILTGKSFYSGYGYTIDTETEEQYKEVLHHVNEIQKLDDKQVNVAKEVYYYREGLFDITNSFEKIFFNNYKGFLNDRDMEKSNNVMVSDYVDFLKKEVICKGKNLYIDLLK